MRRLALVVVSLAALAAPAAVLAARDAPGDGSLVVKNGTAPAGVPVVVLHITGSVIGQVDAGKIVIAVDGGQSGTVPPDVTGAGQGTDIRGGDARVWSNFGTGFKFRAVGGTFTILIYGTGVDLTALGKGWVRLAGSPDTPRADGSYSLNGDYPFTSLPSEQTDRLLITANG